MTSLRCGDETRPAWFEDTAVWRGKGEKDRSKMVTKKKMM